MAGAESPPPGFVNVNDPGRVVGHRRWAGEADEDVGGGAKGQGEKDGEDRKGQG